jgi:nitrite reductase/ring-hydroxylating ferredoxin subunit
MCASDDGERHAAATADDDEVRALREYLATMPLPKRGRATAALPQVPFEPLPALEPALRRAIEGAALEANERYLTSFIEAHSFCPFAAGGRAQGLTARFVHCAETADVAPFLELMERAASDPGKAVVQVIVPMVECSAQHWTRFCHEVTAAGNERLHAAGDESLYVVAPLHPELPYATTNPFALVPLFRRAPDPTIQWVRFDALSALYEGRSSDTVFVDPLDVPAFVGTSRRPPLLDRIAETNMRMAQRLGIPEVERALREIARSTRSRYQDILLGGAPRSPIDAGGACPHHHSARGVDRAPPTPALHERGGRWALTRLSDLGFDAPRRFVAASVELVVVRTHDAVHVLEGRCPHRLAPLSDAIVEAGRLVCPHHGWDFRLDSGRSEGVPGARVTRFRSWVESGLVWVDGGELDAWRGTHEEPFRAEDELL